MDKKITLRNNYHKRLSFEAVLGKPFAMEGGEIKIVDYDIGLKLLKNVWVTEIGQSINPECLPYTEKSPIIDVVPEKPIKKIIEKPIMKEKITEKVGKIINEVKI